MSSDADIIALKERLSALKKKKENKRSAQDETPQTDTNAQHEKPNVSEDTTPQLTATKTEIEQTPASTSNQVPSQSLDNASSTAPSATATDATKTSEPTYSIFVGNLSPKTKKEQLDDHFSCCGTIKRSTIVTDHYTHISKGYAYIEFEQKDGLENAMKLNNTLLLGNTIEVKLKRDKYIR